MTLLLAGVIVALMLIGMPLGFAIIIACLTVIWVDGGINPDNIAAAADAGADTFVAGSAIFSSDDYAATIKAMRDALG